MAGHKTKTFNVTFVNMDGHKTTSVERKVIQGELFYVNELITGSLVHCFLERPNGPLVSVLLLTGLLTTFLPISDMPPLILGNGLRTQDLANLLETLETRLKECMDHRVVFTQRCLSLSY